MFVIISFEMKKITSTRNPEIKYLKKLDERGGVLDDFFLVEGKKIVDEVLKSKHEILKIYTVNYTQKYSKNTILIDEKVARYLSKFPSPSKIFALCKKAKSEDAFSLPAIILDGVQNPENVGGIARSAESFGFKTIYLTKGSVDPFKFRVIRSSMGSSLRVNFIKIEEIADFLSSLHQKGIKIYLTYKGSGKNIYQLTPQKNSVIVFGNEGHGISREFEKYGEKITIPMEDNVESLNILSSASIVMSYFYQRLK